MSELQSIADWGAVSRIAASRLMPVIVMVDQSDCPYCRRVESEFFAALLSGRIYEDKALFGKISIDGGEVIRDANGELIGTRDFLSGLKSSLTPTVLFLDADRNELVDSMVGLSTPDFYGFYLEKAIQRAIDILQG